MRILEGASAVRKVQKLAGRGVRLESIEPQVKRILDSVRAEGDKSLRRFAQERDGLTPEQPIEVWPAELEAAWHLSCPDLRKSFRTAARNIRNFASRQKPREWLVTRSGVSLGQVVRPLRSVGCYVPGGRYPLVSSLLMTVIPAQVAGVEEVCVVSPRPANEVLAAAWMLGVQHVYRVGGAHAIGALAWGTQSVRRVDKIVGPGNSYVTTAKKLVAFDCSIDFLAGPTEAIILTHQGRADFIAADLVAQAEHDPEAIGIFVTTNARLARKVALHCASLTASNRVARQALSRNGCILIAPSRDHAIDWANRIAAEHITVESEMVPHVRNAGSIFVGGFSAQAAGDYASGPNHVLPTGGAARVRGGLSVLDFVKVITVQQLRQPGLARLGPTIARLAEAEGLQAHAESVRVRCKSA
jgi:histidinol dehydrogenase